MTEEIKANIERFESLLGTINRIGMNDVKNFIKKSDFYTAPASTKHHLAEEGGLLKHSLHVYDCLMNKKMNPLWAKVLDGVSDETLTLVSLLHDVCKTYYYGMSTKNQKTYDPERWQLQIRRLSRKTHRVVSSGKRFLSILLTISILLVMAVRAWSS